EARKVIDSNKYENETIPQHYEVPVIGFYSSKFDVALILKNLQIDEWQIIKYLGSGSNAKQIIVKHNVSGIKLRFIDAMIQSTKMKLKQFIKDFSPKATETLTEKSTEKSAIPAKWDYLRHYNLQDTRLMIQPLDYLIDMFFNYKIDMLQFMSMSACANAIKYALAYWDFKLDQDYMPKDDYASFILTQNYWNIKVQNYLEQDKRRNRDTSNKIKESDCAFYRKLFLSTGCHICKARFTSKNPPTLDRINNDRGHSADNVKPCCLFCNKFNVMSSEPHKFIKYTGGPFDMNRMHYICGDTDSMTWAISGNREAEEGYRQKFKYSVMRQKERLASLQLQKYIISIILYLMKMKRISIIV
ncbi:MAG: hypothetical protein EZS28_022544, partial [Streblomastix strix]